MVTRRAVCQANSPPFARLCVRSRSVACACAVGRVHDRAPEVDTIGERTGERARGREQTESLIEIRYILTYKQNAMDNDTNATLC